MRANPTKKLNPKIKAVWRISDAIAISAIAIAFIVPGIFVLLLEPSIAFFAEVYCLVCLVLYITALVVFLFIVTPIRYVRWSYELSPDYLDIEKALYYSVYSCSKYRHKTRTCFACFWPFFCNCFYGCGFSCYSRINYR